MSHFAVLVIGDDYEKQLAPYDENLKAAPRRVDIDIDEMTRMLTHYAKNPPSHKSKAGKLLKQDGFTKDSSFEILIVEDVIKSPNHAALMALYREWSGTDLYRDDAGYYRYTTYNQKSKWDWYTVGGRWRGYFKLKPGRIGTIGEAGVFENKPKFNDGADICLKGDVDVDGMRDAAAAEAGTYWDEIAALLSPDDRQSVETWQEVIARIADIDDARRFFHNQPAIVALREKFGPFWDDVNVLKRSREEHVQAKRDSALSTFAVVKDGQWFEKGEMGWWGVVTNAKAASDWNAEFTKMFDALPEDAILTIVDAHI